jgi:hypothetical protein
MVVLILCFCVCSISKRTCVIYYLSSFFFFFNKVIYLGFNYVILVFPRLGGLLQVNNDVQDQLLKLVETKYKTF